MAPPPASKPGSWSTSSTWPPGGQMSSLGPTRHSSSTPLEPRATPRSSRLAAASSRPAPRASPDRNGHVPGQQPQQRRRHVRDGPGRLHALSPARQCRPVLRPADRPASLAAAAAFTALGNIGLTTEIKTECSRSRFTVSIGGSKPENKAAHGSLKSPLCSCVSITLQASS